MQEEFDDAFIAVLVDDLAAAAFGGPVVVCCGHRALEKVVPLLGFDPRLARGDGAF